MNTGTHAPWLGGGSGGGDWKDDSGASGTGGGSVPGAAALQGRPARIHRSFGYRRAWNFRSATGFTALGLARGRGGTDGNGPAATEKEEEEEEGAAAEINGVLFRIRAEMLPDFDRREAGYDRVVLGDDAYTVLPPDFYGTQAKGDGAYHAGPAPGEEAYVYVPRASFASDADESHPLLQSYVDTVLQGCLEWGGEAMAREFVGTTGGWSGYFLNDTPSSRRPWLFRRQYDTIDRILGEDPRTRYSDRRHPEEFASAFLLKLMRGTWNVPRRNAAFTGRDAELGRLHAMLTERGGGAGVGGGGGASVGKADVAGMGGVGKTQLTAEYCYRYYGSYYGLVVWVNAEGAEALVASYRQLMADTTDVDVTNKDPDEIIGEVKARLFRSKVPWLLVFDNLEDRSLLDKFLPHGSGGGKGHVLVTTRHLEELGERTLLLGCFDPVESVELLCRTAGSGNVSGPGNEGAARELAEALGHLPLALGMAAAYMTRCDVTCAGYLARYRGSGEGGGGLLLTHNRAGQLSDYPLGVASSLGLSLNAIRTESVVAFELLRLIAFCGPDLITKAVLRSLLRAKNAAPRPGTDGGAAAGGNLAVRAGLAAIASLALFAGGKRAFQGKSQAGIRIDSMAASALAGVAGILLFSQRSAAKEAEEIPIVAGQACHDIANFSSDEYEQTDLVWNILKSYSLIVVKGGQGSMHRLLAEVLRASQTDVERQRSVEICVRAMVQSWHFKPEETETWNGSEKMLEHVKSVVSHVPACSGRPMMLQASCLSKEAGVFSAMVLNRFDEAHDSLELALKILDSQTNARANATLLRAQSEALHELGRVHRYRGDFAKAEKSLKEALGIRKGLTKDAVSRQSLADTLHELGVLEVKKHNLELATTYLREALDLRRAEKPSSLSSGDTEARSASTLHQLAAVEVQRKSPSLGKAESLLQEALTLRMQKGQRAATLKQLARVLIRQGLLDRAELYLDQALELFHELYGENSLHINLDSVKHQLGALAFQREHFDQAWEYLSDCLRIRRRIYAYARPITTNQSSDTDENPVHPDVSAVLHELASVAFAQGRYTQSNTLLLAEKDILERLEETTTQPQRVLQARLTSFTWLIKCAKELGDDKRVKKLTDERSALKRSSKGQATLETEASKRAPTCMSLQHEATKTRALVRQYALSSPEKRVSTKSSILTALENLGEEAGSNRSAKQMSNAALSFQTRVHKVLQAPGKDTRSLLLKACDEIRCVFFIFCGKCSYKLNIYWRRRYDFV
jgi:tetratricopeptide (TPR) repeat protein